MKYLNQLEYRHIPYRTKVKMPNMTEDKILVNVASADFIHGYTVIGMRIMPSLLHSTPKYAIIKSERW